MRLGLAQYRSGGSPGESLERLLRLLRGARVEADLIILPEYADLDPTMPGLRGAAVEPGGSPFVEGLVGLAYEYGAYILAGVAERRGGCVYSSVVLAEPGGGWRIVYRKTVLFDAFGYRESSILCPGRQPPPVLELPRLLLRVGVAVCYELRFPELARSLALRGAGLLAVPAAWYQGPLKEEQLVVSARSRALENTFYVAVASQAGEPFTGRSVVADPLGAARLDLGASQGYGEVELDPGLLEEVRERLPVLRDSRRVLRLLGWLGDAEHGEQEPGGDAVGEAQG
ncbi:MAG: nitrilase [Crenarchaeota archaeon]|nr:nitrilase [Thermoproteota archaeon]